MNDLRITTRKNPLIEVLKKKLKLTFTKPVLIAIVLILSGIVVSNYGYFSNSTYTAKYLTYNYQGEMNTSQNFSGGLGISYNTAALVQIDSQYGNISWSIWYTSTYKNRTGIPVTTTEEKFANVTNSKIYSKYFQAGDFVNLGNGLFFIVLKNVQGRNQNATINVFIESTSNQPTEPILIYSGISALLIGIVIFIEEISRISRVKAEGKHLLRE